MQLLRPTTRGWVVLFAGLAWVMISTINRMIFPFLMGCAALALFGASLITALFSLWGISVKRGTASDVVAGEAASLPLIITNRLIRRRQPIIAVEEIPFAAEPIVRTIVTPLKARGQQLVERRVLAIRRGEYHLGKLKLRGGDPAGLFCRERRLKLPSRILVYPAVESVPDLLLHHSDAIGAIAGSPVSAAGMSQDFYGVREYHPMDGLRYIHWRSSAKFGQLMVREFERNAVMSVGVLVDANEHFVSGDVHWSNLEYIIRCAASICAYCAGLYCTFGLAAAGASARVVSPGLASEVRDEVMMELAQVAAGRPNFQQTALSLIREMPRGSVIFCLTLSQSKEIQDTIRLTEEQGMSVRWYCASRQAFADTGEKRTARRNQGRLRQSQEHVMDGVPGAAVLRPEMQLEEALAWSPGR